MASDAARRVTPHIRYVDQASTVLRSARRVLVVEDTADIRELLTELLESEGYCVTSCVNGSQAYERLKQEHFDVVLLDLMMPEMDGLQLLEVLRQQGPPPAPIIAMSAFERFRHDARALGACAFIGKPVDIEHLLQAVETHLLPSVH